MTDALQLRDNARSQLVQIKDLETGVAYLNKIKTIETWVKAEKKDAELQNMVAEQKLRTQRILGGLLKANEVSKHGTNQYNAESKDSTRQKLSDYGLNKDQSSTFQKIASIPDETFEAFIQEKKEAVSNAVAELTTSGALKLAKDIDQEKKKQEASVSDRDKVLIEALKNGDTVVVNQKTDLATIRFAEEKELYVRCDRFSDWGNPFEMGKDGDRDVVCDNYKNHYVPFKPSLLSKVHTLKGKALGCWCAPLECHCDTLKNLADAK